jgi:glycosyltransferase involved in cell wall biosynthesis
MKKIVYIVGGLYQPSGMGQVLSCKVNYLAEHTDWQIYVVLTERPELPFFYKLAPNIKYVNFNINYDELDTMPLLKKMRAYRKKQAIYKKKLTSYLMEVKPDITISVIRREINFINDIPDGSHKIGEIHFAKPDYRKVNKPYLPAAVNRWITDKWQGMLIKQLARLDKFVVLTEEDAGYWDMLSNKSVIPNPLTNYPTQQADWNNKVVISVGRYDFQKGFDMLIEAWVQVASKHPDWQLRIFGPGDNMLYQLQADNLGLKGVVHCMGVSDRVYDEMAKASFYVLSSRYEGFGLVLIEAMAVGLPCVAFACPAGPKDIVSDHQDGLLVERNNVRKLADAINYLIEHDEVRQRYAAQAIINSRRYNLDNIMKMWMSLFDNIS